jgi:hypothetical protein
MDMDKLNVIVEIEDDAPTVEQVVAYERFWKLIIERLLRQRQAETEAAENQTSEKKAA